MIMRWIHMLILAVMIISTTYTIHASSDYMDELQTLIDEETALNNAELDNINENLKRETKSIDDEDKNEIQTYDISQIKRVYSTDSTMISDYRESGKLMSVIGNSDQLYVPIHTEEGEGYAVLDADTQELHGWCSKLEGTDGIYPSEDEIARVIAGYSSDHEEMVREIKFVNAARYNSHFVLFVTEEDKEYVIPYFSNADGYSFENGSVYEADKFIQQLDQSVDERAMMEEEIFGGVIYKDYDRIKSIPFVLGICLGMVMLFLGLSHFRHSK